ncbi:MAG: SDR family NAD(P)-dependent oxidoreductase [SAR324 cluster bacterium]|nr:SDR family NAD(P)-dependent oxidoreductase [SAR324 cluster bacterium]
MDLNNKIALVTGAGTRLGQSIAIYLAEQGMHVAVHYHRSETGAKQTLSQMKEPQNHRMFQADLCQVSAIEHMMAKISKEMGVVSVLINNAADFFPTPLFSVTEEQWDQLFSLNLKAPFFVSQLAASAMKKQGFGKIINMVDVSAERPWPSYLPYCTTKSGLHGLTKGLAKALAPEIQVNGIAPGTVLPPPADSAIDTRMSIEQSLLKRIGSDLDIVQAVDYLLHADFVTGTIMPVDGGRLVS